MGQGPSALPGCAPRDVQQPCALRTCMCQGLGSVGLALQLPTAALLLLNTRQLSHTYALPALLSPSQALQLFLEVDSDLRSHATWQAACCPARRGLLASTARLLKQVGGHRNSWKGPAALFFTGPGGGLMEVTSLDALCVLQTEAPPTPMAAMEPTNLSQPDPVDPTWKPTTPSCHADGGQGAHHPAPARGGAARACHW